MKSNSCNRCVMDVTAPEIEFGENGCSFCMAAEERLAATQSVSEDSIPRLISKIKAKSAAVGSKYDCVVGISGGVDSTYLLTEVVRLGLKPLAVHMDNCWNSSIATVNINSVITALGVDLETWVIPWEEQKRAQLAFLAADVVDVELLYDNCMHAVLFQIARKHKIKFIMGGQNNASEGVEVSQHWVWKKLDKRNIRLICKANGQAQLRIPLISLRQWLWYTLIEKITWVDLLNSLPEFSKEEALKRLESKFGFQPYLYKHYENVFTRFYQAKILPTKFGIDKRKAHLSSLIVKGEMTRSQAQDELRRPAYPPALSHLDMEDVTSKLGLTRFEMEAYLGRGRREHSEFGTDLFLEHIWPWLLKLRRRALKLANELPSFLNVKREVKEKH